MKTKSLKQLNFKKETISNFEKVNGGLRAPLEKAQSVENTTCMSMSACDTHQEQ